MHNVNRWVGIRIDGCALVFEATAAAYLVYGPGHEKILPSQVGFSLTMAGMCQVRSLAALTLMADRFQSDSVVSFYGG